MVVATNSGTSALHLSLVDAGVGPGDEVITAALTFIAAVNPVRFCGAEPVFVDCDKYFCMDPDSVQYFIDNYCEMQDGKLINKKDEILLCTVANGKYVGGSYCCAPLSSNNDGWLEVCLVKPVSLFKILQLINSYKKGQHLEDPRFEKYIHYCRAKKIEIVGGDTFGVSLDGEPTQGNHFDVEIMPQAVMFIEPANQSE